MLNRRIVYATLCASLLAIVGGAARAGQYPAPTGHVNDFAGVMRRESVAQLEAALAGLEQQTGAEVAVVTVASVPDGSVEQAAVDLFKEWGVGKKGQDNGVLILCAVQDRKVRIEVGYGLEPILPDAQCGRIIREQMVPFFKAGDMSAGLVNGGLAVGRIIARHAGVQWNAPMPTAVHREPWWLNQWLFMSVFLLFMIVTNRIRYGRWFYNDGSSSGIWGSGYGGYGGGFGGGGFGGFGGGGSGGGGASGGW